MLKLSKNISGLIYNNDFSEQALDSSWTISPDIPDQYSLTDRTGYLRLKHGTTPLMITKTILSNIDLVCEIKIDYTPIVVNDNGGLVIYRTDTQKAELLKYHDNNVTPDWQYLRLVKKDGIWKAFTSVDRTGWVMHGAIAEFGAQQIGFITSSTVTNCKPMDIEYIKIYRSNELLIANLGPGMRCQLYSSDDELLIDAIVEDNESSLQLDVSTYTFPMSGYFKIYETDGTLMLHSNIIDDMWGGDTYWYGSPLSIYMEDIIVSSGKENSIGNLIGGKITKKLKMVNSQAQSLSNVNIFIRDYNGLSGSEWVSLAKDKNGIPDEFTNTLLYETIEPDLEVYFWMQIVRTNKVWVGQDKGYYEIVVSDSGV